jgi:hypothetical protein
LSPVIPPRERVAIARKASKAAAAARTKRAKRDSGDVGARVGRRTQPGVNKPGVRRVTQTNPNELVEWDGRFLEHQSEYPGPADLGRLSSKGANPYHILYLLLVIPLPDLASDLRRSLKREAEQLSMIADNLEAAATGIGRLKNAPELIVTPSQLRRTVEQLREVFLPPTKAHSNLRLYDTTDYLLFSLYTYLEHFCLRKGLYRVIADLVSSAQYAAQPEVAANKWSEGSVGRRILRFRNKYPDVAEMWRREQEEYVQSGNGGWDIKALETKFWAVVKQLGQADSANHQPGHETT